MKKIKWLDTLKNVFDELLFKTLFANVKKTETNIKRIDRFKKTVAFLLFQIVAISLFCIFGIAESKQLTYEDTSVITGEIDDYTHRFFCRKNQATLLRSIYRWSRVPFIRKRLNL